MTEAAFSQFESQLNFFSEAQLKSIAVKIEKLLSHPQKNADPFYSKSNMKALAESDAQIKAGKIIIKTMQELEALENE